MATLSEFSAAIRKNNVLRPYLYYVEITKPKKLEGGSTDMNTLHMYCATASTPFTNMFTNDDYNEVGIKRKYIYDYDYQSLLLTFYIDQTHHPKKFFDEWMQAIVPSSRKFNYYDDIISDKINLTITDSTTKDVYKYTYNRALLKTVSNIDLSQSATGTVSTFNAEFVFETVSFESLSSATQLDAIGGSDPG
jgi:hypothetical protein